MGREENRVVMPVTAEKISVATPWNEVTRVTPGVLDDDATRAYNYGQCHALAMALSTRLRAPLYVLLHLADTEYDSPEDEEFARMECEEAGELYVASAYVPPEKQPGYAFAEWEIAEQWVHAVVEIKQGLYLDINGVSTYEQLLTHHTCSDDHREFMLVPVSRDTLWRLHHYTEGGVRPAIAVARTFVAPLLRRHALTHGAL
jgi:hypothetical protein